ncbi:hypothetical protein GLP59_10360 [Sulfitobacter sp. M220]|uniref:hypothetical protein n=1 Tax=Sulfitobacter sp. M220 TaxID=2675333 RepID=UPI001F1F481B|nr:hypothetical protein [Sulfitobacter sp. M220]MCF7778042.1 hypothetical protein [Sulfitobacter sp. M220]MCP3881532.1 hypothetical protein [Sulfitobacter sp.]|tara:strand:- start:47 stop:328 length:282 start_codon:yes stop_codon:yes gene_type:complete
MIDLTVQIITLVIMISEQLTELAETMATHIGRSEATLSNKAAGNATLFERLRGGKGCTIQTAQRAMVWFSENWPADLEWPADIPRPRKKKDAA